MARRCRTLVPRVTAPAVPDGPSFNYLDGSDTASLPFPVPLARARLEVTDMPQNFTTALSAGLLCLPIGHTG
jgi:hypothetical protein